jgi:RNA polymerase-binding transcription factor DksA
VELDATDMNEHEKIEEALRARLLELRAHLAKVDRELHKSADSEDQAIELENQEALEVIGKTETTEIQQIEAALKRISVGTYGTCAKCGGLIAVVRRLAPGLPFGEGRAHARMVSGAHPERRALLRTLYAHNDIFKVFDAVRVRWFCILAELEMASMMDGTYSV